MFDSIKRLWDAGKMDESALRRAVAAKGWITESQYKEISNLNY
ncbi:XkdX family protein [Paenibacillus sp. 2TAB23]